MTAATTSDFHVLVVDDDADNAWITSRVINTTKVGKSTHVTSAKEALQHMDGGNKVDVLVLDRMMPEMTGIELSIHMRKNPTYDDIMIIFCTGKALEDDLIELQKDTNAQYMIRKPYMNDVLRAMLSVVARRTHLKKYLSEQLKNEAEKPLVATYHCKNLDDAKQAAAGLARHFSQSISAGEGIYELIENAIEHGYLGIGSNTKNEWLKKGTYDTEITNHLQTCDKTVHAYIEESANGKILHITHDGKEFVPTIPEDMNFLLMEKFCGRGMLYAQQKLGELTYAQNGKEVWCQVV